MKNLANNPNVKSLAETFGLDLPKHYLEISKYELGAKGEIVIKEIKVLDIHGNCVKLADNVKVIRHLSKYPVKFSDR